MPVLDENGREILDQTPVSLPLHYDRPEPLHMRIRRMILEATAAQTGDDFETIEDANDFLCRMIRPRLIPAILNPTMIPL